MKNKLTLFLASLTALGLMGAATSCELFAPSSSSDSNPASTPNSTTSESVTSDSVVDSSDAGSSEEAATYMVTFVADGIIVGVVEYTAGAESITEPAVPSKDHYTGAWETYTLSGNITVNAVYTSVEYTVTFVADGETVGTATYTMDNQIVTEPAVPEKAGYTGAWEAYSMVDGGNITVNAVYTELQSFTVNHITRAKTETVQATGTVKSADTPEITPNTYDGYAYSGQVVDGTTINVYYDLVGVKYHAATEEGLLSVQGAGTLAETTKDGIAVMKYERPTNDANGNEVLINASGYTAGNWIVVYAFISKTHDNTAYTWIQGDVQHWADYKDFALDMNDSSSNDKGWGYMVFQAPTALDGNFILSMFAWNYLGVDIAAVYEMTQEGYDAFFDIQYVDYTINHILRDGDTTQTADTSTVKSVNVPAVTLNTYDGYAYTETVTDGTVINVYYDKINAQAYTVNHITRTKTETVQATDTIESIGVPEVTANTYDGYAYSGQVVDGTTINVYYDLVGVKYHAATEEGLLSVQGAGTLVATTKDGIATMKYERPSSNAHGTEVLINANGYTDGNWIVVYAFVAKTHDNPAYTWIQGSAQHWADYKDFALDMNDSSNNDKGWGYMVFQAPTTVDGNFVLKLFNSNFLGVDIAAVYEMTAEGYLSFFGTEYTINHILKDGDAMETVDTTTVKSVDAPTVEPNTYDGYVYLETVKDGNVINVYYEKNTMKTYTVNHITRAKTETVKETTTVDSKVIPEVAANTYAGYAYSGQVVNGTIINVYYDLVGVKYYAATTEGMLSVNGVGTLVATTKDDVAVMKYERPSSAASGNEVLINASDYTAGNWVVVYAFVSKTHDAPAYTWIEGSSQAWANYIDFALDVNDSTNNDKGWGYIAFQAPTANNGNFVLKLFDSNYLGVDIAAVYEMTQEGYDAFFSDGMVEYTVNHITRAKTETVMDTTTVKSKDAPTVDANTYDGYAYSGQVVNGTTINVYYDLVGVKYYAATTEGILSVNGAGTLTAGTKDGIATMKYERPSSAASGNEVLINASGYTEGNWIVVYAFVSKTHDAPAYTWIEGSSQAWANYIDFALDVNDSTNNDKGWGYIAFQAPTTVDGNFVLKLFDSNYLGVDIAGVYEMTQEGYDAFFSDGMVEYTVKHITRAKTETVMDTTTVKSKDAPTVEANTYDGYAYSGQVVDGTTINVYYDLVGVKYYAATTEGLLSVNGAGTLTAGTKDDIATMKYERPTNVANNNEVLINANGYTDGNWIVIYAHVDKTNDSPAYTWIEGSPQAWAHYKDFALDVDDKSSNTKGWGYIAFQAPTTVDGNFVLKLFDSNYLGVDIAGVYEMTPEAYNAFFGIEE